MSRLLYIDSITSQESISGDVQRGTIATHSHQPQSRYYSLCRHLSPAGRLFPVIYRHDGLKSFIGIMQRTDFPSQNIFCTLNSGRRASAVPEDRYMVSEQSWLFTGNSSHLGPRRRRSQRNFSWPSGVRARGCVCTAALRTISSGAASVRASFLFSSGWWFFIFYIHSIYK